MVPVSTSSTRRTSGPRNLLASRRKSSWLAPVASNRWLAGTVDEVVIQTYQGRATIPGYERYLASLEKLPMPYRVALVEGGEWQAPAGLAADPEYRGTVVFLLPP